MNATTQNKPDTRFWTGVVRFFRMSMETKAVDLQRSLEVQTTIIMNDMQKVTDEWWWWLFKLAICVNIS